LENSVDNLKLYCETYKLDQEEVEKNYIRLSAFENGK
jgi:hypothetical protein